MEEEEEDEEEEQEQEEDEEYILSACMKTFSSAWLIAKRPCLKQLTKSIKNAGSDSELDPSWYRTVHAKSAIKD